MRYGLALLIALTLAGSAVAQSRTDRFGNPLPTYLATPADGPEAPGTRTLLSWTNKAPMVDGQGRTAGTSHPEPMALAGQFLRGRTAQTSPSPEPVAPVVASNSYAPFRPQEPLGSSQPAPLNTPSATTPPQDLPNSLYGGPPAAAPPQPQQVAQARPEGPGDSRLYSVHRSYGMEPDAIPQHQAGTGGYVLIGPSDTAPPKPKSDDDPADDDGSNLARPY